MMPTVMPTALHLLFSGLQQRKLRALATITGVAVAVAAIFSLLSFQRSYQDGLRADLDKLGAHLLVAPKGCPYDSASLALHGANWPCYLKNAYYETVAHTPHVAVAAPVLMSALYLPGGAQAVYCGVLPNMAQLKRNWQIDGRMCSQAGDLLVGAETARQQGWRLGETVSLPGIAGTHGTVAGILAPTDGADDLFIYLPLGDAQRIFEHPAQLTHILVRLDRPESLDGVVANLRGCDAGLEMNVVPMSQLFESIRSLIESTRLLLWCVALTAVFGAGAGLANTVAMAVSERTREIGVLRAIGASHGQVFALIALETGAVCLFGGVLGIAASLLGAGALDAWLRGNLPFAPHTILVSADLDQIAVCLGGAVAVGVIAGLLPALRAAHLSPSTALRATGADI